MRNRYEGVRTRWNHKDTEVQNKRFPLFLGVSVVAVVAFFTASCALGCAIPPLRGIAFSLRPVDSLAASKRLLINVAQGLILSFRYNFVKYTTAVSIISGSGLP
jgi:hypothetical protein